MDQTFPGFCGAVKLPALDADALITDSQNQVDQYSGSWGGTRTFAHTVWLPEPNNPGEVKAKLEDGIPTIRAGRADMKSLNIALD